MFLYRIFQVKASSFVGLNERREVVEGKGEVETSASTIHTGVHQARPDAVCVFHLHPPYSTAIGTAGLLSDTNFNVLKSSLKQSTSTRGSGKEFVGLFPRAWC